MTRGEVPGGDGDRRSGMPALTPLAGRDAAVAEVAGALTRPPALVLIEGEAGIGKTRLVHELMEHPPLCDTRVLVASCPPLRQPLTLSALVEAIQQATGDVAALGLSGLAGALRPLFPEWASSLPAAPEPLDDATAVRHRLFRALAELLACLGSGALVVEDVHWADEATLEFLLFLLARGSRRPSLVLTYRPEDVPEGSLLRRLSSRLAPGTTRLRTVLGALDAAGTASMVSSLLDGGRVPPEFAVFLHAHTGGLPLAVEESVRLLRDRRDLVCRDGQWMYVGPGELAVPPTVRDAVLERAHRLGPAALAMLRTAAVLDAPAGDEVLVSASGLPPEEAGAGLDAAMTSGLLEESGPRECGLVSFRHVLAARAISEEIPGPQRRRAHLRAARALETVAPLPLAQLARHLRAAGETRAWADYAEQAADLALAAGDGNAAVTLIHDLIMNAMPPAASVVRMIRKLPFNSVSSYQHASDLIGTLRVMLDRPDLSPAERAEIGFQLGRFLLNTGEYDRGAAALERAAPGLVHQPAQAAYAMALLGLPVGNTRSAAMHRRWLDRAAALMRDPSFPSGARLPLTLNRLTALLLMGDEAGWKVAAEIPEVAAAPHETGSVIIGCLNIGDAEVRWGRYSRARERLESALALARRHHYDSSRDLALSTLAHLDWFTGAWQGLGARAAALADNGSDLDSPPRLEAAIVTAHLDLAAGAAGAVEEKLRLVLSELRRHGIIYAVPESAAVLAGLCLSQGRVGDALELTEEPVRIIMAKGIWLWATDIATVRVRALTAAGREEEAASMVTAFARGLRGRDAPAPAASLATCRALLADSRGEHGRAAGGFARAAARWEALPRPYDALLARESQGRCLINAGQAEAGLALLAEVRQALEALGAIADADRVVATLRHHGVKARRPWRGGRRGYGDRLSPREAEVVHLVVAGQTNREIAQALCRSPNTVAAQLRSAMRKLGVSSRTEVAVRVARAGGLDL